MPETTPSWWEIHNATDPDEAELLLYGYIGEWDDISSRDIVKALSDITAKTINVKVNSYGGSVFTAQAIFSALKRHSAVINVFIDGIAASAATIITCAGDKVVIPANAMMMIHNPLACVCGYAADLRDKADSLDKVRDSVIAAYRTKTALSPEKLIELMDAETWLNADEAVALGFADDLDSAIRIAASMNNGIVIVNGISFDLSRFINVPAALIENCAIQEISDTTHVKPWAKNEDEIVDLETLKNNQPDLYEKIINEGKVIGQSEERQRIQEIEKLAPPGHSELVNKAKFETGVTAATMAIEILNAEKGQSKAYLENRQDDASPLQNTHDNQPASAQHEEQKRIITNAIAAGFTKNR
ncbi:head maturation protease, ClpP-related [Yersinia proxima]|uniref:head maturation protease, ClpP-related n=1 Tax=Yersinia proxima TaxID=2890316 RepID=UPI0037D66ED1